MCGLTRQHICPSVFVWILSSCSLRPVYADGVIQYLWTLVQARYLGKCVAQFVLQLRQTLLIVGILTVVGLGDP